MALSPHPHTFMRSARVACVAGLAASLALGGTLAALPSPAHAATAQTLSELSRLQGEVNAASSVFAEASAKAGELNAQVDAIANEILEIEQVVMPATQRRASAAVSNLYKMRVSSSGTLALLLNAETFEGFLSLNKYLGTIQNEQIAALEELNALEDELNGKLDELSQAKDQADAELERAGEALSQVQSAAAQMQQRANSENAAEAEAARKAAEQAAAMAQQHQQQTGNTGSVGNAGADADNGGAESTPQPESPEANTPAPEQTPTPEPAPPAEQPSTGWMSGVASYYGIGDGFMGGTTASGEIVTETSMGIAMLGVPFGTRVEIRWGGNSVIAYVNDRGPYVHGRVIDMQPAVARALGFLSVGVDTVEYRFL